MMFGPTAPRMSARDLADALGVPVELVARQRLRTDALLHRWGIRIEDPRAPLRPLARLLLLAFLAGVVAGLLVASFAVSALSSSSSLTSGRDAASDPRRSVPLDGGSAVRATTVARSASVEGDTPRDDRRAEPDHHADASPASARPAATAARAIPELIRSAAIRHGVDPAWLARVVFCESSNDTEAIGDGGRSIGLAQYQARTFLEHSRISGLGYTLADYGDPAAQLDLMSWAFAHGRSGAWTCR